MVAGMNAANANDLTPTDQMIYWTCAAAQRDVELQDELAGIYAWLAPNEAPLAGQLRFDQLLQDIGRMMDAGAIRDGRVRRLARALLDDVDRAHRERNRLVHDLWANAYDAPKTFDRMMLLEQYEEGPSVRHLEGFEVPTRSESARSASRR